MLSFQWFLSYFLGFCKSDRLGAGKEKKKKTVIQRRQPGAERKEEEEEDMEPNMMLATIVGARGLYMKNKSSLDAFATVTLQGKGSLRSRCATEAIHTEGDCRWDEVCEFKLSEKFNTVAVAVHAKAKIGSGELIGKCELELENAKLLNGQTNWLRLKKKNSDEKYRGEVQIKMDFSYEKPSMSVSSLSLNQIGNEQKEGGSGGGGGGGLMSKMKRKITQAKNGHKKAEDTMSMASAWSATSKTSTKSAKFFGKLTKTLGIKDKSASSAATLPVGTFLTPMDNHLDGSNGGYDGSAKGISRNSSFNVFDNNAQHNNSSSRPPSASFANNTNNSSNMNPFADSMSPQPPPRQMTTTPTGRFGTIGAIGGAATLPHAMTSPVIAQDMFRRSGSIRSVASSGFGGSTRNQQKIIDPGNSDDLLAVIDSLKLELQVKESRMKDMQGYMDLLVSRVMERNPELLAVPAKPAPRMRFF